MTFDGGKIRNFIIGTGSTYYTAGVATKWEFTSNGGYVDTPNGGLATGEGTVNSGYSIMAFGTATLLPRSV